MKQVFLSTTTEFKEIETLEPGSWINLVNPSQSESMEIASAFNIDIADLRAPLDAEEMSRMTIEDEYTLIIVDVPIKEERNNQTYYVTIPLGIILTEEAIITTCLEKLPLLDIFINRRLRNFYTFMRSRFIFQILYRNAELYLSALRTLDRKSEQIESQLHKSTRNEELIELMELEKTIVYFKASLKTNERVIKKLTSATSNIKKYLEDEDLLEDTLIETQQAIEMADIYGNILHSMTDTFASIISNNQNNIMKTLALVTIVMSIPTMIFSAYGMNFRLGSAGALICPQICRLCAVIAAKMRGASQIVLMSRHQDRQQMALEFGATAVIAERGEEGIAKVREILGGGADAALECVGTEAAVEQALGVLHNGGRMGFVGVPHYNNRALGSTFAQNISVAGGAASVTTYDKQVLLKAVLDGDINPGRVFTSSYKLEDIDQAYKDMDERKTIKAMIVLD